jgi:hypothetical protein
VLIIAGRGDHLGPVRTTDGNLDFEQGVNAVKKQTNLKAGARSWR